MMRSATILNALIADPPLSNLLHWLARPVGKLTRLITRVFAIRGNDDMPQFQIPPFQFLIAAVLIALLTATSADMANAQEIKPGQTFRDCPDCPEMVVVPAGRVTIGSPRNENGRSREEGPQIVAAFIRPFAVGKFEVTFAHWDACVADGGCSHRPDDKGWGRGNRPVINVSWNQVTGQYLPWLSAKTGHSYRLPSEAEWEHFARAGTVTAYWWGGGAGAASANCKGCDTRWGGDRTAPVGSFAANPFGVHDVHGNVFELTADCWNSSHEGARNDGKARTEGACNRRVIKGGSWFTSENWLRSAARMSDPVGYSNSNVGFRVVRAVEDSLRLVQSAPPQDDNAKLQLTAEAVSTGNCKDGLKWVTAEQSSASGTARLESCGAASPTLPIDFTCNTGRNTVTVSVPMVQSVPRTLRGPFPVSVYAQGQGMRARDGRDIPDQIRQFDAMRQDGPGKGRLTFEVGEADPLLQALAVGTEGYVNIIGQTLSFHLDGARLALTAMRSACGLPRLNIADALERADASTGAGKSLPSQFAEGPSGEPGKYASQRPRRADARGCGAPEAELARQLREVTVQAKPTTSKAVPIGTPTTFEWSFSGQLNDACRRPLYLVLTAPKRTRFEGTGFLAIPGGAPGPFEIKHDQEETRLFFPLHLLDKRQGEFKIKSYEVGPLRVTWALVQAKSKVANPRVREDFALGQEYVSEVVKLANVARYTVGEPKIIVRDNFTLDKPKTVIRSNSGEFDLQVFEGLYRVLDATTGELLIERTGVDPNFAPGSRFVSAFVHGGQSIHSFASDIPAPNLEIIDLYAQSSTLSAKPLFLAWVHSDAFFLPGELPCVRNSCSAALKVWQALVDNDPLDLSGLTETYKSMPDNFQINIDIETALVAVNGGRSAKGGWASLVNHERRGKFGVDPDINKLERTLAAAGLIGQPILASPREADSTTLNWSAQGRLLSLSQHCIPKQTGACDDKIDARFVYSALRLNHDARRPTPLKTEIMPGADESRMVAIRSAISSPEISRKPSDGDRSRASVLMSRIGDIFPEYRARSRNAAEDFEFSERSDVHEQDAQLRVANVKTIIARSSPPAAQLLPSAEIGLKMEQETGGGCVSDERLMVPFLHRITKLHQVSAESHIAWLFRMECTNGASGRYWLWLLLASIGGKAEILDLSYELRHRIGSHSKHVSGTTIDPYLDWSWDWPQTLDGIEVVDGRHLLTSGTWPNGRWAMVFDLEARKPTAFLPNLENADGFGTLALSNDARTLIQANTNGQLFFYDTTTGKVILRGVETDDELIIYDENGYYLSSPEGSQFLNLKFPGIPGYSTVGQFASTLDRPDAIKAILAGKPPLPKPKLTAPPELRVATMVDGSGSVRRVMLNFETASEVGLRELIVYVDGRPEKRVPLSGERQQGQVTVDIASEARWISAVAVDRSGYRSIARGQGISGASDPVGSRLFAITVGTDVYSDAGITQLSAAKLDATNFGTMVSTLKRGLYSQVELTPFPDEPELKPKLLGRLRDVVATASPRDTIMLFAAAHGDQGRDGRFYLVTRDTVKTDLERTAIAWDDIAATLQGVKARVIVFLDACRSGLAGQASGTNDDAVTALLSRDAPITVIAASKGRQNSEETSNGGYFTSEIVRAVTAERDQTDTNGNGAIELAELYGAIKPRVVRATDNRQTPWVARNQMVGEVPLF